jgi:predicted dehydrogenase
MSKEPLRIGLIGGGAIVRHRHMPGLAAIDGVEVVAVCNRRPESSEKFARDYHIPNIERDWRGVVDRDDVDIIWIGTTPYMHCPITLAALEAGKHVFCQARMCMNLDEARQMVEAGRQHPDQVVRFCPPPTGMGGDRTMQRLLNEDRFVGEIRHVHLSSVSAALLDPDAPLTWRLQRAQSGQNVMTLGIYFEVLNRWLGPTRRITAVNRSWTEERIHPETQIPTPAELPESVNLVAELASGAVGVYIFNGVSAHGPSDFLTVHGTGGSLTYHFDGNETKEWLEGARMDEPEPKAIPIPDDERRQWNVEEEFIRAVRTGECDPIIPDLQAGLVYMSLIDAVHRSAAAECRVDVSRVSIS